MKTFKFLSLFLALCLCFSLLTALPVCAEEPQLSSSAAILVDRFSGNILFSKAENELVNPASMTKIMTVLLAVEDIAAGLAGREDPIIATADAFRDVGEDPSVSGIRVGDELTLWDLCYCAMLPSGSEACNLIGERLAGSVENFVDRMNRRAALLGCENTHFVNTHGAPNYSHKTTATDLARIALTASRNPLFMEICGTAQYTVRTKAGREWTLKNSNELLGENGISGMKTGFAVAAGYCLTATAERDGRALLAIVFHAPDEKVRSREILQLLDYGFQRSDSAEFPSLSFLSGDTVSTVPGPSLHSANALVMDQRSGEVLYSAQANQRVYPADTAKLMTALLAVEAVEQGEVSLRAEVTVSESAGAALGLDGTRLLSTGETLTLESLLYCALISSADDAANAIAECVSGSQEDFVALMNDRAQRLGCQDTHFSNPSGLHSDNNWTTTSDMAKIALEASNHDILSRLYTVTSVEIPETNLSPARTLKTSNALLVRDGVYGSGYVYERASGIKTGYNAAAGYCLISSAEDEESGIRLLCLVFGGDKTEEGYTNFQDAITLFDWVFANFSYQEVLNPNKNIASVDVNLGMDTDYVNLRPAGSVTLLLPNNYNPEDFQLDMTVYSLQQGKIVTAPVTAGEVLGEVSVMRDGQNCGTVKLVAAANVDLSRSGYITSNIQQTIRSSTFRILFLSVGMLLLLYLIWVIVYRIRRLKYKHAVRQSSRSVQSRRKQKPVHSAEKPQSPSIEFFAEEEPSGTAEDEAVGEEFAEDEDLIPEFMTLPSSEEADPALPQASDPEPSIAEPESAAQHEPKQTAEDPFDLFKTKAEKDYFEEFFRRK